MFVIPSMSSRSCVPPLGSFPPCRNHFGSSHFASRDHYDFVLVFAMEQVPVTIVVTTLQYYVLLVWTGVEIVLLDLKAFLRRYVSMM